MKISVIGLGKLGSPLAAVFAIDHASAPLRVSSPVATLLYSSSNVAFSTHSEAE